MADVTAMNWPALVERLARALGVWEGSKPFGVYFPVSFGEPGPGFVVTTPGGDRRRITTGQALFLLLETPPRALATDERGLIIIPPVELFGAARPRTADVLDGTAETTWGWPR